METIYLDNAATTRTRQEVIDSMLPFFSEQYGNPSSIYELGRSARAVIEEKRAIIAKLIGAEPSEIYFTGSGTEADNWAIKGVCDALSSRGNHIITTQVEHHAVLNTCKELSKKGFEVTYLPVDKFGRIDPVELIKAIKDTTILITIMYANNELGTIQPIKDIGEIAKANNIYFHTDAVQACGHIPIDVSDSNIDLLSFSGHKIYAPKGIGVLYVRSGVKIKNLVQGGAQEFKRRAGTENVPYIAGIATALKLAVDEMEHETNRIIKLRDKLIDGVLNTIPHSKLNGSKEFRLPNIANFSFEFIEGESMLLLLDMNNIAASSGSACTSGSLDPSHVLLAIGLSHEKAHGSLRFSLGRYNTEQDIDKVLEVLPSIVSKLRDMSPLYEEYLKSNKTTV